MTVYRVTADDLADLDAIDSAPTSTREPITRTKRPARKLCECGRPAVATVRPGSRKVKRSRRARRGQYYTIEGHDYCPACWARLLDSVDSQSINTTEGVTR